MPVRPARVGRVGVIGAPVAKTAVVAKAVNTRAVASGKDGGSGRSRHTWKAGSPEDLAREASAQDSRGGQRRASGLS